MTLQESPPDSVLGTPEQFGLGLIEDWDTEAPLRLVAWAVDSLGGTAKPGEIQDKLRRTLGREPRPEPEWKKWWDRVRPEVKAEKYHRWFTVKKNNSVTFSGKVDTVPLVTWDDLPHPVKTRRANSPSANEKKQNWLDWLFGKTPGPPPGRFPTKTVCNAIAKFGVKDAAAALEQTMFGALELLSSDNPSAASAAGWAEAVSRAFLRWREVSESVTPDEWSREVGTVLTQLALIGGSGSRPAELLVSLGSLAPQVEPWRRDFAAGMWRVLKEPGKGVHDFYKAAAVQLERDRRAALAEEMVLGALSETWPAVQRPEMDRILDDIFPDERFALFQDLIVRSAQNEAPKPAVLGYLADSRHNVWPSAPDRRLDLLMIASLLLSSEDGPAVDEVSERIGEMSTDPDANDLEGVWPALLSGVGQHISDLRVQHAKELEDQRQSYETRLEEVQRDADWMKRRVDGLRSQIAEGREESRLEIRQDMLLVIAETLESLPGWADNPEELLDNVKARLRLALGAGGAEEFGTIGETVPYDPKKHRAVGPIPAESPVLVSGLGTVVRGKLTGDRILIKARVVNSPEVEQCK